MCDCANWIEENCPEFDDPDQIPFWAYLHKNGELKVKRWILPISTKHECDLCHARQEKADGNSFIQAIVTRPFMSSMDWPKLKQKAIFLVGMREKQPSMEEWIEPYLEPDIEDRWKDIEL